MMSHSISAMTPKREQDALADFLDQKLLSIASSKVAMPEISWLELFQSRRESIDLRASLQLHQLEGGIQELVTADPRFLGHTVKLINSNNGSYGFYPSFVGTKLLQRTFDTGSSVAAIEWLQKVLSTKEAAGTFTVALWNVPVHSEVQLTPEVRLVPFDSLPNSGQKANIENSQFKMGVISTPLAWQPPSSALVAHQQVSPFLLDQDEKLEPQDTHSSLLKLMTDITLLLTLVGPRVPVQVSHWFNYDDPDLEFALLGQARGSQMMEILPRMTAQHPLDLNPEEAADIIQRFGALSQKTRLKVETATERLRRALSRHQVGDKAVEVSIALETICGDTEKNEMTHKVSVRATRLLGGDSKKRERNSKILKSTYSIRSKLVHQGIHESKNITVEGVSMGVEAVINEACHLCADLIKAVIRRGSLPQWSLFDINEPGSWINED